MKRLILVVCLLVTLSFYGCNGKVQNTVITPPVTDVVLPVLPEQTPNEDEEDFSEETKKKRYAVSLVNGLRIRSLPSTSSQTLGYLDKSDAVLYYETDGDFYKTTYKEREAYVYAPYCSLMEVDCADSAIENAIDLGCSLLGYPYVWGSQRYHWGNGKLNTAFVAGEFDCSALVQYIYYISNGVILDVTTRTQVFNGTEVAKDDLARGDLMFFTNSSRQYKTGTERIGHVGIYFGNNYVLHTASDHAVLEPISTSRWNYYVTARRVV